MGPLFDPMMRRVLGWSFVSAIVACMFVVIALATWYAVDWINYAFPRGG